MDIEIVYSQPTPMTYWEFIHSPYFLFLVAYAAFLVAAVGLSLLVKSIYDFWHKKRKNKEKEPQQ